MAVKIAMVKPIPASVPTKIMPEKSTLLGRRQSPIFTESRETVIIPTGFPTTKPTITPMIIVGVCGAEKLTPEKFTPAFANAKSGITRNVTHGVSLRFISDRRFLLTRLVLKDGISQCLLHRQICQKF